MCFCSENVDFLYLRGGMHGCQGGRAWLPGGMHGCRGACVAAWGVCMAAGGVCVAAGGVMRGCQGGMRGCWGVHGCRGVACMAAGGRGCMAARGACVAAGGCVLCDLSYHAFDVTYMLSPHQLRASSYAPAYILVGHVTRTPPPPVDRQTPVKT